MWRSALVVVAACSHPPAHAPAPAPVANTAVVAATVTPPAGTGEALTASTVLVDTGTALYVVTAAPRTAPIAISGEPVTLERLDDTFTHLFPGKEPSVMLAAPASASAERIGHIAHVIQTHHRCLVPIVDDHGKLATAVSSSCQHDHAEAVTLTVYVTPQAYWVGLSRVNEFKKIDRAAGNHARDKLAIMVHEWKVSAFFADREVAEVTGDGGTTYGELVEIASSMAGIGFTSTMLVAKQDASALPLP